MEFQQFYLGCLAQASYLIGSNGEAAIVDPRRDVDEYVSAAAERGLSIRAVLETHLHADFVSGHLELASRTGARVYISHRAGATFDHVPVRDGDTIRIGGVVIQVLETPGHTPESVCYLVFDEASGAGADDAGPRTPPKMVLTGDTLFIGDVGRPDLSGAAGQTAAEMARTLYASLHEKLLRLDDSVLVYPAHGAGSLCGKNLSRDTCSTIGAQRKSNIALQAASCEEFVDALTRDQPEVPAYFPLDVELNRAGARPMAGLGPLRLLTLEEARSRRDSGAAILDVRSSEHYASGHLAGSINIGLLGQFASWAGTLLDAARDVVIVAETAAAAAEARMRLARVGLERVPGWVDGSPSGALGWRVAPEPLGSFPQMPVQRLAERQPIQIVDVRRAGEWEQGFVEGATHAPLHRIAASRGSAAGPAIPEELRNLDRSAPTAVVCGGGYRSIAACALLRELGFKDLIDVQGGMAAWTKAGLPTRLPLAAAS
jgi:glyoxylase-like metal-dependent hydrolase (beta-lactamase superfamily II)/rhodanese-related sulfurtransferase